MASEHAVHAYLEWIGTPQRDGRREAARSSAVLLDAVPPSVPDERLAAAVTVAGKIERDEPLSPADLAVAEAIIIPGRRPVIDVVDGRYATPHGEFAHFGDEATRTLIEASIPSVGRIELPGHPSLPFGGTGFLVGDAILMTNRHVAEIFASGLGREGLAFVSGRAAGVDFRKEHGSTVSEQFSVNEIVMIHPYWDMALVSVDGLDGRKPLMLTVTDPGDLASRDVAVIGYPAFDPRNDVDLQHEIFNRTYDVKRLQPGRLRDRAGIGSYGNVVSAVTHDSSTLGGNSGSVVLDVGTGLVVALHFAGRYLEANYAVPAHDLGRDPFVVDAGVRFDGTLPAGSPPWQRFWSTADPPRNEAGPHSATPRPVASSTSLTLGADATWTVPIEITVRVGGGPVPSVALPVPDAATEARVEPFHDPDLAARTGYDEDFLCLRLPLPTVREPEATARMEDGDDVLRYEHFSIVMHRTRRLALYTAVNVDKTPDRARPEPGRDYTRDGLGGLRDHDREQWFLDPRILGTHQLPDRFYNKDRQAFDKGHVVRREDPGWGATYDEVRRANGDTFHSTNCAPQVGDFNRQIWLRLENIILAEATDERLSVLTGPVFAADDPVFHGVADDGPVEVQIPQQYWKVAVAHHDGGLGAFAFVLDQDLSDVRMTESLAAQEFVVPPEWRGRMLSIAALEDLIGQLRFPRELHEADQFAQEPGERVRARAGVHPYQT